MEKAKKKDWVEMKKAKKSYTGQSDYTEGSTELSHEQKELLESISKALN